jgi:elongation factor 1-alpha
MISGASQADVGLLLVPASAEFASATAQGNHETGEVQGQSRQHARLINLLGVKQLIVGINKMDSDYAGFKEERYMEIRDEVINILVKVGWNKDFVAKNVPFIPYSGFKGDNLIKQSENMPWWKGQDVRTSDGSMVHVTTLLDCLNNYAKPPPRELNKPLRAPISGIYNIKGVGQIYASRIEQGVVHPGDEVIFLPQHTDVNPCTGKIFSIEMHHRSQPDAKNGDNIGMCIRGLSKDNVPIAGSVMILKSDTSLRAAKNFTCVAQIIDFPNEIKPGYSPIGFVRTTRSAVKLVKINWKMGKETGNKKLEDPTYVKQGDACELVFEPQQPFVVEPFESCEGLSRIACLDGNGVVLLAKVTKVEFN